MVRILMVKDIFLLTIYFFQGCKHAQVAGTQDPFNKVDVALIDNETHHECLPKETKGMELNHESFLHAYVCGNLEMLPAIFIIIIGKNMLHWKVLWLLINLRKL